MYFSPVNPDFGKSDRSLNNQERNSRSKRCHSRLSQCLVRPANGGSGWQARAALAVSPAMPSLEIINQASSRLSSLLLRLFNRCTVSRFRDIPTASSSNSRLSFKLRLAHLVATPSHPWPSSRRASFQFDRRSTLSSTTPLHPCPHFLYHLQYEVWSTFYGRGRYRFCQLCSGGS
jgi:hypothetical protein